MVKVVQLPSYIQGEGRTPGDEDSGGVGEGHSEDTD